MKSKLISNRPLTTEQVLFANVLESLDYCTEKVISFFSDFLNPIDVRNNANPNAPIYHRIAKEMLPLD
jgi:hypothetical protein